MDSRNSMAASATLHCLTGCAIGEIAGLMIGTAMGLGNAVTIALAVGLAYLFGYALSTVPLIQAGLGFFGVPTLIWADGRSVFGPVIIEPPVGDEAVRLWDHVEAWATFDGLYEMKRPKRPDDMQRIAAKFRPYLEARDWNTVQKEAP